MSLLHVEWLRAEELETMSQRARQFFLRHLKRLQQAREAGEDIPDFDLTSDGVREV